MGFRFVRFRLRHADGDTRRRCVRTTRELARRSTDDRSDTRRRGRKDRCRAATDRRPYRAPCAAPVRWRSAAHCQSARADRRRVNRLPACATAQPLSAQFGGFFFQDECAARCQLVSDLTGDSVCVCTLPGDRRRQSVIEEVAQCQLFVAGRMQRQRRAVGGQRDFGVDAPDFPTCRLPFEAGFQQRLDKLSRGAIKTRWFRSVQFDEAIVDAQTGKRRENVFDEADLRRSAAERDAPFSSCDVANVCGDVRRTWS